MARQVRKKEKAIKGFSSPIQVGTKNTKALELHWGFFINLKRKNLRECLMVILITFFSVRLVVVPINGELICLVFRYR